MINGRTAFLALCVLLGVVGASSARKPLAAASGSVSAQDYDYDGSDCLAWTQQITKHTRLVGASKALFRSRNDPAARGKLMTLTKCSALCTTYRTADGLGDATYDPCYSFNYQPSTRVCTLYTAMYDSLDSRVDKRFYSGFAECEEFAPVNICEDPLAPFLDLNAECVAECLSADGKEQDGVNPNCVCAAATPNYNLATNECQA